jgi:hypothetical protein
VISLTIILASVGLALIYALAFLFVPGVGRQIEQPKHRFQQQLQRYDRDCRIGSERPGAADVE